MFTNSVIACLFKIITCIYVGMYNMTNQKTYTNKTKKKLKTLEM